MSHLNASEKKSISLLENWTNNKFVIEVSGEILQGCGVNLRLLAALYKKKTSCFNRKYVNTWTWYRTVIVKPFHVGFNHTFVGYSSNT